MKKLFFLSLFIFIIISMFIGCERKREMEEESEKEPGLYPNQWFMSQRMYPKNTNEISTDIIHKILNETKYMQSKKSDLKADWESMGPYNISGRITDIESCGDTIFVASASGGIFRSIDGGSTWSAIFDENGILPIGDIAIHPDSHNIIIAGTGEANATSQSYIGNGLYKSIDCGITWTHIGLDSTYYIGRIVFDPQNPQRIFVAATGAMYSKNSERGIYRSVDGGATWEKVLFISDSTAGIDVIINPDYPDTIYAAMWERWKYLGDRVSGGPTSGIYRSEDGGDSWVELTNGLPPDGANPGRIGLAISVQNTNRLYAIYTDENGYIDSLYVSDDNGDSWTGKSYIDNSYSYGWYFGNIRVSPYNQDEIWVLGLNCYYSDNAGDSWTKVFTNAHVDFHAMCFSLRDTNECFLGSDGGFYFSSNGISVDTVASLSNMQFYEGCIDPFNNTRIYGGAQDNGTNRTENGAIDSWEHILGGDGFYCLVSPIDSNIIFAEYQWGSLAKSTDFGLSWTYVDDDFYSDRTGWSTPYIISPHNSNVMYLGTYRLYKSTNEGENWTAMSGDLTNNLYNYESVITTIDISPLDSNLIYIATSDGKAWRSDDGGNTFTDITGILPNRWITRITAHPRAADSVIVSCSGFRWDEQAPHVLISGDKGNNWTDISGNLPDLPVNDVIFDPDTNIIYIANDAGVMYSADYTNYYLLGNNFPPVPVTDIDIDNNRIYLYAFTYGRGAYRIDISQFSSINDKNINAFVNNGYIKLFWTSVSNCKYNIYKKQNNNYTLLYSSEKNYYIDSTPNSGKNNYRIDFVYSNNKIESQYVSVDYLYNNKAINISSIYYGIEKANSIFKIKDIKVYDISGKRINKIIKSGKYFLINNNIKKDFIVIE